MPKPAKGEILAVQICHLTMLHIIFICSSFVRISLSFPFKTLDRNSHFFFLQLPSLQLFVCASFFTQWSVIVWVFLGIFHSLYSPHDLQWYLSHSKCLTNIYSWILEGENTSFIGQHAMGQRKKAFLFSVRNPIYSISSFINKAFNYNYFSVIITKACFSMNLPAMPTGWLLIFH